MIAKVQKSNRLISYLLKSIFFLSILLVTNDLSAQYQFEAYSYISGNELKPGLSIGYWNRMSKYRVEFYPSLMGEIYEVNATKQSFQLGVELGTRFYFLDFKNECECPVFSKSGRNFMKGIFLELNPGIAYSFQFKEIALKTGLGAGYDFGISDLITISPIVGGSFFFQNQATPFLPLVAISMVIRPDYVKKWH